MTKENPTNNRFFFLFPSQGKHDRIEPEDRTGKKLGSWKAALLHQEGQRILIEVWSEKLVSVGYQHKDR